MSSLVRGGHYGTALVLAGVELGALYVVFRAGALYRCDPRLVLVVIPVTALAIPIVAHVIHYDEVKSFALRHLPELDDGKLAPEGAALDRDEAFRRYVGWVTEKEGDGAWAYLRLQTAVGWEGYEGNQYRVHTVRTGFWVWFAWLSHLVFFLVGGAAAMGAAIPQSAAKRRAKAS